MKKPLLLRTTLLICLLFSAQATAAPVGENAGEISVEYKWFKHYITRHPLAICWCRLTQSIACIATRNASWAPSKKTSERSFFCGLRIFHTHTA